jgi:hypothetical protein
LLIFRFPGSIALFLLFAWRFPENGWAKNERQCRQAQAAYEAYLQKLFAKKQRCRADSDCQVEISPRDPCDSGVAISTLVMGKKGEAGLVRLRSRFDDSCEWNDLLCGVEAFAEAKCRNSLCVGLYSGEKLDNAGGNVPRNP